MSDLKLAFYGDDFTGSTDSMEALASHGLRTVLFLEPPAPADLARFPGLAAAGVAGTSRTMTPEQMDAALPPAFERIRRLGARLFHYKVCSTFDSSPAVGSIGRAIEIGRRTFGGAWVPLVVGAPALRRYCLFGNLFATVGTDTFRIDRHPTMRHHPVTPMDEGDLRVHLGRQTSLSIALMDILHLSGSRAEVDARAAALLASRPDIVLFDVLDEARLAEAGRIVWESGAPFAAGSSGVEYALGAHWRAEGTLPSAPPAASPGAADRLLAVSGSCSPATDAQIGWALEQGFDGIRLQDASEEGAAAARARDSLRKGRSVVLYTARGPRDPAVRDPLGRGAELGERLGRLARQLIEETGVRRVVVAGGDTSGRVARRLGIDALEMLVPIAPGSPLCRAYSRERALDGLEIALKGGQVGSPDYFGRVLRGSNLPAGAAAHGARGGSGPEKR